MKKIGMTLLVLLLIFSLVGCSGQKSGKAPLESSQSTSPKISTPQPQPAKADLSKRTDDQSTANNKSASQPAPAAASKQLTDVDSTLHSLNDVLKSLDDVSDNELIIPTP